MATILIVDNYRPNQRVMSFVLEHSGHTVVFARNGWQALRCLETTVVDLIITDLTMPVMDGLTLTREVRSNQRLSRLPIIVVTASAHEQDLVQATSEGANCLLTKPFDSEDLVREVERLTQSFAPSMPAKLGTCCVA